jgi:hypothetical protein
MPRIVIDFSKASPGGAAGSGPAFEALDPAEVNAWRVAIQRQADREAQIRLRTQVESPSATIQAATGAAADAASAARESARKVRQAEEQAEV